MEEAKARLKSDKDFQADRWRTSGPHKLLLMIVLLWLIWDQKQLYAIVLVRQGVWAASLDSLFTTCATVIALVAAASKRELWGLAAGAVFSAVYCVGSWTLENVVYSFGHLADWIIIHIWLSTLYLLIISAIAQLVIYIRNHAHSNKEPAVALADVETPPQEEP